MLIRYWQPFSEIESIRRQLNHAFNELNAAHTETDVTWTPAIEVQDTPDNLVVKAQLAGVDPKEIDVQVTREAVAISGERKSEHKEEHSGYVRSEFRYGKFHRVVQFRVPIQNDQVQADFTNGVLTLTLPKVQEVRNKVVKINLAELAPATELESSN